MEPVEVGSYILEEPLGKGGMGEVYLARHKSLGTRAAIKVMTPAAEGEAEFRERFHREAQTQAKLSHPHIARVLDHVEQDGRWYLITEFLPKGTLKDLMKQQPGPLPVIQAVAWARQALKGLAHAHQLGIVHRDIKPANILLNEREEAALTDFGLAKLLDGGDNKLTTTGVSMGTPEYMSPEQILGSKEIDHRTDIYALGVVLYEMLAGRVPFPMDSVRELQKVLVVEPPSIRERNPEVPAELDEVVLHALAKDPAERWASAAELAAALIPWEGTGAETFVPVRPAGAGPVAAAAGVAASAGHPAVTVEMESSPTVLEPADAAGAPAPGATPPPPPPAAPPPSPASKTEVSGLAALPPIVPPDPSLSSTYAAPRSSNLLFAVAGAFALIVVLAVAWLLMGRGADEEVATVQAAAQLPAATSSAGESGEPGLSTGLPAGPEPAESGEGEGGGTTPGDSGGDGAEVASESLAAGSGTGAQSPPSKPTVADGPASQPASPPVAAATMSERVEPTPPPLPRVEPRVAVLALGDRDFAMPFGLELEDRLRALGLDAEDARSGIRMNDLTRRYGNDLDLGELVPAVAAEGYDVLVFARVTAVGEREIYVLGTYSVATTSQVRVDIVLVPDERPMHRAWSDSVEHTTLNAQAKAEAMFRGANVEMADAIRSGWQEYRSQFLR